MASTISPFLRNLQLHGFLGSDEQRNLLAQSLSARYVRAGRDIVGDGRRSAHATLLISGIAFRYRVLEGGRRQITGFYFAGDIVDLSDVLLGHSEQNVAALTLSEVATLPQAILFDWMTQHANFARLAWREVQAELAIAREWVVNVGRRTAHERVAHLLCELVMRLQQRGLGTIASCHLPLTQTDLADATGLSSVHVNRTLQLLRTQNLIQWKGKVLAVLDWQRLCDIAGFDQAYLHQGTSVLQEEEVV